LQKTDLRKMTAYIARATTTRLPPAGHRHHSQRHADLGAQDRGQKLVDVTVESEFVEDVLFLRPIRPPQATCRHQRQQ
jgi:hypothetical protein